MEWEKIYSSKRTGFNSSTEQRTDYQRDYDRLIFSSGFRRLQNKTQVFPLPGSTFVHNRLTHSLEVASVGRSLGKMTGRMLAELYNFQGETGEFYRHELQNVIASACLAHDIGNPAFGHSGEKAISRFFIENASMEIESKKLQDFFQPREWEDLINFEGNANAVRILTHQFYGKSAGGISLTYATIAAIVKYPCESGGVDKSFKHRKKYGFFQSEKETVIKIFRELEVPQENEAPVVFSRHPFVYLTEAADDICYRIIDFEDAHRLGILPYGVVENLFINLLEALRKDKSKPSSTQKVLSELEDQNEKISYLRAKCIGALTNAAAEVFIENREKIIAGKYTSTLLDDLEKEFPVLKDIVKVSIEEIYNHETVVQIEIAGYNVMWDLLSLFVPAILKSNPGPKDEKVLRIIPSQFKVMKNTFYNRVLSVLDYVSGMTDPYATELYRKLYGIDIPKHR